MKKNKSRLSKLLQPKKETGKSYLELIGRPLDLNYYSDGVYSSNGQYHVRPENYESVLNSKELEVDLPETVITAPNLSNYRSSFDRYALLNMLQTISSPVVNTVDQINTALVKASDVIGDYTLRPVTKAVGYIADNLPESYSDNEGEPYIMLDDVWRGGRSRLGSLGLVRDSAAIADNNYSVWHMPAMNPNESKQKYEKRCAKFANTLSQMFGRPTAGDAWTQGGIFGHSIITDGYHIPKKGKYSRLKSELYNRIASAFVAHDIDNHELLTGDIVGLYYTRSPKAKRAWKEGRGKSANTHTGRILRIGPRKKDTYVVHNESGNVLIQPIGDMLGPFHRTGITYIKRPNKVKP